MPSNANNIPSTVPPPLRWTKRIAKLMLLTAILLSVVRWAWGVYADHQFANAMARARDAREPFKADDFIQPSIPDSENAAKILQSAAAAVVSPQLPALRTFQQFETASLIDSLAIRGWVSSNSTALVRLRDSRGRAADWNIELSRSPRAFSTSLRFAGYTQLYPVAKLADNAAKIAHVSGNDSDAIEYWRDILAVGKAVRRVPTLQGFGTSLGFDAIATGRVLERASELKVGTVAARESLAALIAELLDESDLSVARTRAVAAERSIILYMFRNAASSAIGAREMWEPDAFPKSAWERAVAFVIEPAFTLRAARYSQQQSNRIAAINSPNYQSAKSRMPSYLSPTKTTVFLADRVNFFDGDTKTDSFLESDFRVLLQRRAAAMALAIRLYRADHADALPVAADLLVPKYLPALPQDPYDPAGHSIRYAPAQFRRPILYSLGPAGIDNLLQQKWDLPPDRLPKDYRTTAIIFDLTPMFFKTASPASMPK